MPALGERDLLRWRAQVLVAHGHQHVRAAGLEHVQHAVAGGHRGALEAHAGLLRAE
ncbi:MAG: hypothetical protein IPN77_33715 [Sandaracinaceae bacterium]|nr:hypothetical protein [Sandaracinaceae bacterium]